MYATRIFPASQRFLRYFAAFSLQLVLITSLSFYVAVKWGGGSSGAEVFRSGMSIASIPVGGNTYEEARKKLIAAVQARKKTTVRYVLDGQAYPIDLGQLDVTFDIEATMKKALARSGEQSGLFPRLWGESEQSADLTLQVAYDRAALAKQLGEIGEKVNRPAVPAKGVVSGDRIAIVPEVIGYRVDIDKSLARFDRFLMNELSQSSGDLKLEVEQVVPDMRKSDLEAIEQRVAEASFPVAFTDEVMKENTAKLIARLNGSVVFPNQAFSFLEKTGPYTEENGYVPIQTHTDEQTLDELGGGAGQIATALYQAVLKSRLAVLERHAAVRPVTYAEAGLEAVVGGDGLDLRFANDTKKPVFIHAELSDNRVSVSLFSGKGDAPKVTLSTEKSERIKPNTIIRVDKDLSPNQELIERKGSEGFTVTAYRSWMEMGGKEVRQKVSEDYYKPLHNIIAVGPVYEKDKEEARAGQNAPQEGAAKLPAEAMLPAKEATSEDRPPDIPAAPDTLADSGSGGAGEPRVVDGIIYQN
ncbi:VanW family protein [Brevibacillus sp. GCM10020057]|uniref:VanW family protein n=1 Tax=Brevibacillus sp. GCM10020057 TaxID=3317327 RepID=UPI00362A7F63